MSDRAKAAELAGEIEEELSQLRERFSGREADHFSFGLKFSSWGVIAAALRAYAAPPAPPEGLREAVAEAFRVRNGCSSRRHCERVGHACTCEADADVALTTIHARGFVVLPREPTPEMIEAAVRAGMIDLSKPGRMPTLHDQARSILKAALAAGEVQ